MVPPPLFPAGHRKSVAVAPVQPGPIPARTSYSRPRRRYNITVPKTTIVTNSLSFVSGTEWRPRRKAFSKFFGVMRVVLHFLKPRREEEKEELIKKCCELNRSARRVWCLYMKNKEDFFLISSEWLGCRVFDQLLYFYLFFFFRGWVLLSLDDPGKTWSRIWDFWCRSRNIWILGCIN